MSVQGVDFTLDLGETSTLLAWAIAGFVVVPPLAGFLLLGLPALAGGLAVDLAAKLRLGSTATVLVVGAALFLENAAAVLAALGGASAYFHADLVTSDLGTTVIAIAAPLGWTLGLLVSGFPGVLRQSRTPDSPEEPKLQPA